MKICVKNELKDKLQNLPMRHRWLLDDVMEYLEKRNDGKVCCLSGIAKTGKTTMMLQAVKKLNDLECCLWIDCEENDNLQMLRDKLNTYCEYKYVFVDNFTWLGGLGGSSILADDYAYAGRKIVLTGEQNIFLCLRGNELLDRMHLLETSYISYAEFHDVTDLGIEKYITSGDVFGMQIGLLAIDQDALTYVLDQYYFDTHLASPGQKFFEKLKYCEKYGLLQKCGSLYMCMQPWLIFQSGIAKRLDSESIFTKILANVVFLELFRRYNTRNTVVFKYKELIVMADLETAEIIIYSIGNDSGIPCDSIEAIEKKVGGKIIRIENMNLRKAEELLLRREGEQCTYKISI